MNRLGTLQTLGSSQVNVVERHDRGTHPVNTLQQPLQQPRKRRLASALCTIEAQHDHPILHVVRNPRRHRHVEVGDERVRRPRDPLVRTPSLHVRPNIGKLRTKPTTKRQGPKHEGEDTTRAGTGTGTGADTGRRQREPKAKPGARRRQGGAKRAPRQGGLRVGVGGRYN